MQNIQQPKSQVVLDEERLDAWFWSDGFTPGRLTRKFSLYELKSFTGIPLTRLPDVLRRKGWFRVRDRDHKVDLWTRSRPFPDEDIDY